MKSIVIAAALAAFAFCAPASAYAQQDICNASTLSHGYTARDVQEMCAARKAVAEHQRPARTASNTLIAPRINLGLNNQRRGRPYDDRWSSEDDSRLDEMLARKSQHVLQGIPTKRNHRGFTGEKEGHQPVPPGCREFKRQSGGEMFIRVICDRSQ